MRNNTHNKYLEFKLGGTRVVILVGLYVIKFAFPFFFWRRFCYGCLSNIEERYQWKNQVFLDNVNLTSPQEIEYNPSLYCFPLGLFSIQPRVTPSKVTEYSPHIDEHLRTCNTGYRQEIKVSFDYGVGPITIRKNKLRRFLKKFV